MARKDACRSPAGNVSLSFLDGLFDRAGAARAAASDPFGGLGPAARDVAVRMAALSPEERRAVMGEFCRECGADDPDCVCWRDE